MLEIVVWWFIVSIIALPVVLAIFRQDRESPVQHEHRYIVIKVKDAKEYLSELDGMQLDRILDKITDGRTQDGKAPLDCVVVEHDWPEYEPTWAAIAARVNIQKKEGAS